MQKETLFKRLGWHSQSNNSNLLFTTVFVLHVCLPTDFRNFKYSDPPQQGAQPGPAVLCAFEDHTEQVLKQFFIPLEHTDQSREMLSSRPHNFMYKTSISINILFSGFSTCLSLIQIILPLQHKASYLNYYSQRVRDFSV